jgi:hypothetical protein
LRDTAATHTSQALRSIPQLFDFIGVPTGIPLDLKRSGAGKSRKRNIEDIGVIEKEIFEHSFENGKIIPKQRKYWDVKADGIILVSVRLGNKTPNQSPAADQR